MEAKSVFNCRRCGECCRGEGGIYIRPEEVAGPARLLDLSEKAFIAEYTEPRYGQLALKTNEEGFCLMQDPKTGACRIHAYKPPMCRDWPFFYGILGNRDGFEAAKQACPGIAAEASWEEFVQYHRRYIRSMPPRNYFDPGTGKTT